MKKFVILIILICSIFFTVSCYVIVEEEDTSIDDALRISTWMLDEKLEGTGYWAYDENDKVNYGHWVSYDNNTEVADDDVFVMDELELNKPRTLAPLGYKGANLNFKFEFDGIVHIKTDPPNDETIRIFNFLGDNGEYSKDIKSISPVVINVFPIGKFTELGMIINRSTLVDREYYLDIACYKLDGTPVIYAKLKLTVLDDPEYPWYDKTEMWLYTVNEKRSRFLSIELVEYEYSDIKKFDEFEKYDALYN